MADSGSIANVYANVNSMQAIRFAQVGATYAGPKRTWKTDVYWFWGRTGTGKSRTCYRLVGSDAYTATDEGKWWCGYGMFIVLSK